MPVHLADITARRDHSIGHRIIPAGEVYARVQFRSEEDAAFFRNHIKWSAFRVDLLPAGEAAAAGGADKELVAKLVKDTQAAQADAKALRAELEQATAALAEAQAKLAAIAGAVDGEGTAAEGDDQPAGPSTDDGDLVVVEDDTKTPADQTTPAPAAPKSKGRKRK